jgi:hypothetical protein
MQPSLLADDFIDPKILTGAVCARRERVPVRRPPSPYISTRQSAVKDDVNKLIQ